MPITNKKPNDCPPLLAEGWVYLDVRTPEEFESGHPAGAFNVPLFLRNASGMQPNLEFSEVVKRRFPLATRLIVGCASGPRADHACRELAAAGFTEIVNMECGFQGARDPFGAQIAPGWLACGLPSEKGRPAGRTYADLRTARRGA